MLIDILSLAKKLRLYPPTIAPAPNNSETMKQLLSLIGVKNTTEEKETLRWYLAYTLLHLVLTLIYRSSIVIIVFAESRSSSIKLPWIHHQHKQPLLFYCHNSLIIQGQIGNVVVVKYKIINQPWRLSLASYQVPDHSLNIKLIVYFTNSFMDGTLRSYRPS